MKICLFGCYDKEYSSNKLVIKGLRTNGVEVFEINAHVSVTRMDRKEDMSPWQLAKRVLKKYRLVAEIVMNRKNIRSSDAIYVGYPGHFDVIPAFFVAKLFGKKLIFNPLVIFTTGFVHEQGILNEISLTGKILRFGEKVIYKMCDLIFADTPYQKEHLVKTFNLNPGKIQILSIGADEETYRYKMRHTDKDALNVVYYGLYSPIHSVETIIKAAALSKDPAIRFIMVGNGNTFEKCNTLATSLGLKNIVFYQEMTEKDAIGTLQSADIFLGLFAEHDSVKRAVPNKVFQGIALGKTVVTADSPGIRSLFTDRKNIYLCQPENPFDLAKAIQTLRNDQKLRITIGNNAYALFKEKFSSHAIGKVLKDHIFEHLR